MNTAAPRQIGIDLIKILACFLVVALHTCYKNGYNLSSVIYYSGVTAIPLFFMVNGYLLFGKTERDQFYGYKKIYRIVLLTFTCVIVYQLGNQQWNNPFIQTGWGLFLQRPPLWHFWFLGSLSLIYLLFRPLDFIYLRYPRFFVILVFLFIGTQIGVDILNIAAAFSYNDIFSRHIPQTFRLEVAFGYFCLGGFLKRYKEYIANYICLPYLFLLYSVLIIYQLIMVNNIYPTRPCEYFYDSPLTMIVTVMLFSVLSKVKTDKLGEANRLVTVFSGLVMLIYIVHPFVLGYIPFPHGILRLLAAFILSAGIAYCINVIPILNKLFRI